MSQIIAMAKRLQEAEEIIENFKKSGLYPPRSPAEIGEARFSEPTMLAPNTALSQLEEKDNHTPLTYNGSYRPPVKAVQEAGPEPLLSDLSLDENGKVRSKCTPNSPSNMPLSCVTMAQHRQSTILQLLKVNEHGI